MAQADAVATAAAYAAATQALRRRLTDLLTALWRSLGGYHDAEAARFVAQAVPLVAGGQQQMASLTGAYLAADRRTAVGRSLPHAVSLRRVTAAAARNGTPPSTVYHRPFDLVWRRLGAGIEPGKAIQAGLDRAVQSGLTDLQLTKVRTAQQVLAHDPKITGWRRQIEGAHSCGLCIVASANHYRREDLMPIHPACDCSVQPIYGRAEPIADRELLASAKDTITATFGHYSTNPADLRRLLIVHEHGELGPVLAVRGRPFLGPSDIV